MDSEAEALECARRFLLYLPDSVYSLPERGPITDDPNRMDEFLANIIPRDIRRVYKMRPIIESVVDRGMFFEMGQNFGATIRHGVRAMAAINQTDVPWYSFIVRNAFGVAGGAHQPSGRFCVRYAWASGRWGSLPLEGGIEAAYRAEIDAAPDLEAKLQEIETRLNKLRSPFRTAETFWIEEIFDARKTRPLMVEFANLAAPARRTGPAWFTMRP